MRNHLGTICMRSTKSIWALGRRAGSASMTALAASLCPVPTPAETKSTRGFSTFVSVMPERYFARRQVARTKAIGNRDLALASKRQGVPQRADQPAGSYVGFPVGV